VQIDHIFKVSLFIMLLETLKCHNKYFDVSNLIYKVENSPDEIFYNAKSN